jgi:alpha-L-fucosidase
LLTNAAGRNSNLLLNVGPMANGQIPPESVAIMDSVGQWVKANGKTIYGTRGGPMAPQVWGVTTQDDKHVYLHLYRAPSETVRIEGAYSNVRFWNLDNKKALVVTQTPTAVELKLGDVPIDPAETIIVLDKK